MVAMVVPLGVVLSRLHAMVVVVKSTWKVRLVFRLLKLRFADGVLIAQSGVTIAGCVFHAQLESDSTTTSTPTREGFGWSLVDRAACG